MWLVLLGEIYVHMTSLCEHCANIAFVVFLAVLYIDSYNLFMKADMSDSSAAVNVARDSINWSTNGGKFNSLLLNVDVTCVSNCDLLFFKSPKFISLLQCLLDSQNNYYPTWSVSNRRSAGNTASMHCLSEKVVLRVFKCIVRSVQNYFHGKILNTFFSIWQCTFTKWSWQNENLVR